MGKVTQCRVTQLLFDIGYVKQGWNWFQELLEYAGTKWIDQGVLGELLSRQIKDASVYFDSQGCATDNQDDAVSIRLDTGVDAARSDSGDGGNRVFICYTRNRFSKKWTGVTYELGQPQVISEQKHGFFAIGYAKIYKDGQFVSWQSELRRLTGSPNLDFGAVDKCIDEQRMTKKCFFYCNYSPANALTADMQVFDTGCEFAGGSEKIYARFLRDRGNKWSHLEYVKESEIPVTPAEIRDDDFLFRFAEMPKNWPQELAKKVLRENWSFTGQNDYGILKQYLKHTYLRASIDGHIAQTKDAAAFDTGLVDDSYQPMYAYFVANNDPCAQPWRLMGFCVRGADLGKKMSAQLAGKLSDGVSWFKEDPERVYFEPDSRVEKDVEHCMVERAFRLTSDLWKKILRDEKFSEMLQGWISIHENAEKTGRLDRAAEEEWIDALRRHPQYNAVLHELAGELDNAIELAQRKAHWDYTTAVPIYYPRKQNFAFLLPLSFGLDKSRVDCALVVERLTEKAAPQCVYQAQTVLTLPMAYNDARLLKKPDVSWLRTMSV